MDADDPGSEFHQRDALLLQRFFAARVRNREDIRDLSQTVHLRLLELKAQNKVKNTERCLMWLAKNVIVDDFRRRKGSPVVFSSALVNVDYPGEAHDIAPFESNEGIDTAYLADLVCAKLSATHADVFIMDSLLGMSLKEIAAALGISPATVKTYRSQARRAIRSTL